VADTDHAIRLHIGDYTGDTQHLTTVQHGIYILLLMHCFRHKGFLPKSRSAQMRIARIEDARSWKRSAPEVLALFYQCPCGLYRHKRIDKELDLARIHAECRGAHCGVPTVGCSLWGANECHFVLPEMAQKAGSSVLEPVRLARARVPMPDSSTHPPRRSPKGDQRAARNGWVDLAADILKPENE